MKLLVYRLVTFRQGSEMRDEDTLHLHIGHVDDS